MTNPDPAPRHFSMIRSFHLADFLTLGNAACGVIGILLTMRFMASDALSDFLMATLMAPAAFIFDVFDGKVARWRQQHSILGRELDSLADVISFGVAPAALGYAAGLNSGLDCIALVYFVCCGVSRLARFNVTAQTLDDGAGKVRYFEGTPIPTSVVLTAALAVAAWYGNVGANLYGGVFAMGAATFHPMALLFIISGTLMISKTLHVPKF